MNSISNDYIVVGAGIVGLATAYTLLQREPGLCVLVVDKEARVAAHQTGHNSGVIHAGVYYEPGSLKARLCRAGLVRTLEFCREHAVPVEQCGKLLVATTPLEDVRLRALHERAQRNGTVCRLVSAGELRELEPHIAGRTALLVSETGIVDYVAMAERLREAIERGGGAVRLGAEVREIREESASVAVATTAGTFHAQRLIVCGGLQADRLARAAGLALDFTLVPFRGDYYRLPSARAGLIRHLIYPVPDPQLPFLGVHLTRMIDGGITVGPSAMLAFKREGYGKADYDVRDVGEMLCFPGLWRLLARYHRAGLVELGCALSKRLYLRAVRKYCPELALADLTSHAAGIRAQAVAPDGRLVHDFLIRSTARVTHVCNAPSPAATAALPIAEEIVARASAS